MKKTFVFLALLTTTQCLSQLDRQLSFFLSAQGNRTTYDRTKSNNSEGIGLGLQTILNTPTFVQPTLEINGDLFGGTKELNLTRDGKPIDSKSEILSIHAGPLFSLSKRIFLAATVGSHLYNSRVHFSARPSIGIYPTKRKKDKVSPWIEAFANARDWLKSGR